MNAPLKPVPEAELITQLGDIRRTLTEERERLLQRVATIDEALAAPAAAQLPNSPKATRTREGPGTKEAILAVLTKPMTVKEVVALLPAQAPKSVEAVLHGLATAGKVAKDNSTPKKFSAV